MRELVVLSGKGGTGKTTVAAALIRLHQAQAYADCDVDAPNLHLLFAAGSLQQKPYLATQRAAIEQARCNQCGLCMAHCRFGAVIEQAGSYHIEPAACEGCAVCTLVCPQQAIQMRDYQAGQLCLYEQGKQVFSTAELQMGNGTSGLLVNQVKENLHEHSEAPWAIIDGSPGIGCPVIASLNGSSALLIVAEPSLLGISDLQRLVSLAERFQVKTAVCVNKFDLDLAKTEQIEKFCWDKQLLFAGRIPFDPQIVIAADAAQPQIAAGQSTGPAAEALQALYQKIIDQFILEE